MTQVEYHAIVSSDWSECLSPNGPFDPIAFTFPELRTDLEKIFRDYTGNKIKLGEAVEAIQKLVPAPLNAQQMDRYLAEFFATYRGVPELIEWCLSQGILFMINSTGTQGYFQRAIAKGLIPPVPVVSAHPMLSFPSETDGDRYALTISEIDDKPRNTLAVAQRYGIPLTRIVVVGDSGGDGPHFQWGASVGAFLIGSMTKASLNGYCESRGIKIDTHFGLRYRPGQHRDVYEEMMFDFADLKEVIRNALAKKDSS